MHLIQHKKWYTMALKNSEIWVVRRMASIVVLSHCQRRISPEININSPCDTLNHMQRYSLPLFEEDS